MARFSTTNSWPLDHRTTASGTSIRGSFGSVTVSESLLPRPLLRLIAHADDGNRHRPQHPLTLVIERPYLSWPWVWG